MRFALSSSRKGFLLVVLLFATAGAGAQFPDRPLRMVVPQAAGSATDNFARLLSPELAKHSPALSLIYEVTRLSLEAGLDCDYMTGEQAYKLRLATSAVQLFQLRGTPAQLASAAQASAHAMKLAS